MVIDNNSSLASGYEVVSKFLNTLDIYVHARKDGETLGAAIQEAMIHELPVISHTSQWNAHIDTIGPGGKVCELQDEYNALLLEWVENMDVANEIGRQGRQFAIDRYSWDIVIQQIEGVFEEVYSNKRYLLSDWRPLPLGIYKKRKIYYTARFFLLNLTVKFLVKFFGQKSTQFLPKMKNYLRLLLR